MWNVDVYVYECVCILFVRLNEYVRHSDARGMAHGSMVSVIQQQQQHRKKSQKIEKKLFR